MTERKYTLKYDLSDGQTGLDAGSFSVWDGDDGNTFADTLHYNISWGLTTAYDSGNIDKTYTSANFDPSGFSTLILESGYYYNAYSYALFTGDLGNAIVNARTYIGKDGDDASGKNGTYITAVRVEAA